LVPAGAERGDTDGVAVGARRDDAGLIFGVEGRSGVVDGDVAGVGINQGGVLAAHRRPCCTVFHSMLKFKKNPDKRATAVPSNGVMRIPESATSIGTLSSKICHLNSGICDTKGVKVVTRVLYWAPYITASRSILSSHHIREGALYFSKCCLRHVDVDELLYCAFQGPS
jgi:hypothetical protein